MRKIRKIAFQNAAGERYGLNGENNVYVTGLSGLGFSLAPTFADLNHGFFLNVSDESEPQGTIPFTLVFTKEPYAAYQTLVDWLSAAGTVTIVYDPTGEQEYCRDVTVNFLQKGELTQVGWLEVPCSFFAHAPWYKPCPMELLLTDGGTNEVRRYDYVYTNDLRYGSDSPASLSGFVPGAGHIPAALKLTYQGAITNPRIRLTGVTSGKTYGVCSVTAVFVPSDTLEFCTRYEKSYVKRITPAGTERDLLDVLDLGTTPFFRIPVDEPCTITIEADAPFTGRAELLIYYYYRSV